jgi:hypothetical protein
MLNRRHILLAGFALSTSIADITAARRSKRRRTSRRRPKWRSKVVTRTYSSSQGLYIVAGAGATRQYPAEITVGGLPRGKIEKVTITIHDFFHGEPGTVDMMLVAPTGRGAIFMSDVGENEPVPPPSATLTFDDQATSRPPTPLVTGRYLPTNLTDFSLPDYFPDPAPKGVEGSALAVFNDSDPNGTWSLFISQDENGLGEFTSWSLTIRARIRVRVRRKRRSKRGKR